MFDIYGLDMVKKYENQILGTLPPWVSSTYLFILLALFVKKKKWCVVLFLSCRLLLATFQWMADHIPSKIKIWPDLKGKINLTVSVTNTKPVFVDRATANRVARILLSLARKSERMRVEVEHNIFFACMSSSMKNKSFPPKKGRISF